MSETPPILTLNERQRKLREGAVRFTSLAVTLGASESEAVEALEAAWRSLQQDGGGEE